MPVCPNCGGVSEGSICVYCRTPLQQSAGQGTGGVQFTPPPSPPAQPYPQNQPYQQHPQQYVGHEVSSQKSWWVVFITALFFGYFGVHRFYAGKIGTGVLWLFTIGIFAAGWIVDIILVLLGRFTDGQGNEIQRPW